MADRIVQYISLIGFFCVAVLFIAELARWRSVAAMIGRRQRVVRVMLILMVELLFVLLFFGPWVTGLKNVPVALAYWSVCTLLALAVFVLAILDLRGVLRGYVALHREMFRGLGDSDRREK